MKKFLLAMPIGILLGACATVVDETRTNAVIEKGFNTGERYQIRTRTLEGANGTYEQTSVIYRSVSRVCIKDSPGDCEKTAEFLIDDYFNGGSINF